MKTITLPDGTKYEPGNDPAFFRDQETQAHMVLDGDAACSFLDVFCAAWITQHGRDLKWHAAHEDDADTGLVIAGVDADGTVRLDHWDQNRLFVGGGEQIEGFDMIDFPYLAAFELTETLAEWYDEYGPGEVMLDIARLAGSLCGTHERRGILFYLAEYAMANDDRAYGPNRPSRDDVSAHYRAELGW